MTEDWTKWEGLLIDGVFPLRRFLGKSDHSVVFLTEHGALNLPDAAIKLVPAGPVLAEAQLSCWTIAGALTHPHLIRIFGSGRCRLGGHPFLYVVMEYADQTLAQLLPHRALTPEEARELLLPTLDALAFLHGKNLVQGQLKPQNVLVVDDQVKLASDTVRPAGDSAAGVAEPSVYDAPEAKEGRISAAGDVWALGVTIVEAMTQRPPAWPDARREIVSLPAALPPLFADIARRCLSRYPAGRPSITGLVAQIKRAAHAPGIPITEAGAGPVQASKSQVGKVQVAAVNEARVTKAATTDSAAAEAPVTKAAVTEAAAVEAPTKTAVSNAAATAASLTKTAVSNAAVTAASMTKSAVSSAAATVSSVTKSAVSNAAAAVASVTKAAAPPSEAVATKVAMSPAPANEPPRRAAAEPPAANRMSIPVIAAGALAVLVVIWICWRLLHGHPNSPQPPSSNVHSSSQPAAPPPSAAQNLTTPVPAPATAVSTVLHQEIPEVSRHARESIRGRIKVTVRVTVDRSGNVVGQRLVSSGSSKYFARLASVAAGKWKFAPADRQSSRTWLLQFEFTRGGVSGHAAAATT
jgi:TonB family protein